jgi:hypothetical protein
LVDPLAVGLPAKTAMRELSTMDVFLLSRGVVLLSCHMTNPRVTAKFGKTFHYCAYHCATRVLLLYPEVLVVKDEDIKDLTAFHQTLLAPPFELRFSIEPGSLVRQCRQLWIADDRVGEVSLAHSRQRALASKLAV